MADEQIVRADYEDLKVVMDIFEDCKSYLNSRGILQWDEKYPNQEYFETALKGENLFVLKNEGQVLGAMVLDEWQTPEWETAQWTEVQGNPLILHSFCVHPSAQGGGYGGKMLQYAEVFAKEQGYPALRLDSFSGNEAAVGFYQKRGYTKTGIVKLKGKPRGHDLYHCYEKLFK
ncbi:GNAT family N-acetyltransferase [Neobacillus drentensis]|uniref:GNAT family N-acetyltransferase n=1 Tax=Neobacillus drentensis TaxID=220684 RepID=UPI003000CCAF